MHAGCWNALIGSKDKSYPGMASAPGRLSRTLTWTLAADVIPASGVYISRTTDLDSSRKWQSVTNIGMRPTFNGQERTIETFLLTTLDGEAPKRIRLEFLKRLREEENSNLRKP